MTAEFNAESTADEVLSGHDLSGRTVFVTGVSSGLGIETARALAGRGASLIGSVRDLAKGEKAAGPIRDAASRTGARFELVQADLGDLASLRRMSEALAARGTSLDLIIANAGVMATPFAHTSDGFELQFGTNFLGHFVLVNRLASLLREGGRLVVLSSSAHRSANVDIADPNFEHSAYDPWVAYGRSKTADALLAVAFDERRRARGVRASSVHPGGIQTGLGRHLAPGAMEAMVERVNEQLRRDGKPPHRFKSLAQGAATSVWAGVVAEADKIGGRYCENCHVSPTLPDDHSPVGALDEGVRPYALDPAAADALWTKAEERACERF